MNSHKTQICCICGREFSEYGNNPWPVKDENGNDFSVEAKCCDACNFIVVIPLRMHNLSKKYKE